MRSPGLLPGEYAYTGGQKPAAELRESAVEIANIYLETSRSKSTQVGTAEQVLILGVSPAEESVEDDQIGRIRFDPYEASPGFQHSADFVDRFVEVWNLVENQALEYDIEGMIGERQT